MKLEWSAAALADLDRFVAFLHERHPRLAKIIAAEIKDKAGILSEHPLIGRAIEGRPQYRELVLKWRTRHTSFTMAVRHGRTCSGHPRLWLPSPSPPRG